MNSAMEGALSCGPKSEIFFFVPTKPPLTRLT